MPLDSPRRNLGNRSTKAGNSCQSKCWSWTQRASACPKDPLYVKRQIPLQAIPHGAVVRAVIRAPTVKFQRSLVRKSDRDSVWWNPLSHEIYAETWSQALLYLLVGRRIDKTSSSESVSSPKTLTTASNTSSKAKKSISSPQNQQSNSDSSSLTALL